MTLTTDGALGLTNAMDTMWPQAFRIRCGFHTMQNWEQKVPTRAWPAVKAWLVDRRAAPTREKAEKRRDALVEQ